MSRKEVTDPSGWVGRRTAAREPGMECFMRKGPSTAESTPTGKKTRMSAATARMQDVRPVLEP
jgi:hypothetical protein